MAEVNWSVGLTPDFSSALRYQEAGQANRQRLADQQPHIQPDPGNQMQRYIEEGQKPHRPAMAQQGHPGQRPQRRDREAYEQEPEPGLAEVMLDRLHRIDKTRA